MEKQIKELENRILELEKRMEQHEEKATAATVTHPFGNSDFVSTYGTTVKGVHDIPEDHLNNVIPDELYAAKSEKDMLLTSTEKNCRLLNDALESELRKIHNECPVFVSGRCIDLINMTIQYTQIYLDFAYKIKADTLRKSNYLAVDELMK